MNRLEAYSILSASLERYRELSASRLHDHIGKTGSEDFYGASGTRYTVEIWVAVDASPDSGLVVHGQIHAPNAFRFEPLEEIIRISNPGNADDEMPPG